MKSVETEAFFNTWNVLTRSHYYSSVPRLVNRDHFLQIKADKVPLAFALGVPVLIAIGAYGVAIAVIVYFSLDVQQSVFAIAGASLVIVTLGVAAITFFRKRASDLPVLVEFDSSRDVFVLGPAAEKIDRSELMAVRLWRGCTAGGESAQQNMHSFLVVDMVTRQEALIPLLLASNSFSRWEQIFELFARETGMKVERRKVLKEQRPSGQAMFELLR